MARGKGRTSLDSAIDTYRGMQDRIAQAESRLELLKLEADIALKRVAIYGTQDDVNALLSDYGVTPETDADEDPTLI